MITPTIMEFRSDAVRQTVMVAIPGKPGSFRDGGLIEFEARRADGPQGPACHSTKPARSAGGAPRPVILSRCAWPTARSPVVDIIKVSDRILAGYSPDTRRILDRDRLRDHAAQRHADDMGGAFGSPIRSYSISMLAGPTLRAFCSVTSAELALLPAITDIRKV
jgi:hypothetical protein